MNVVLLHVPKQNRVPGAIAPDSLAVMAMPMGLLSLADTLDRAGFPCEVVHVGVELRLDPGFSLRALLAEERPGLVGFSLHWHHQLADVLAAIADARAALPDAWLIVGGQTASGFAAELLAHAPELDAVVRGDGEVPLRALAEALRDGTALDAVPNLSWRGEHEVVHNVTRWSAGADELSEMRFTRFELLRHASAYDGEPWVPLAPPVHGPGGRRRTFHLSVGRGCNLTCAFCAGSARAHRELYGRRGPTVRAAAAVVADLRALRDAGTEPYVCYDPAGPRMTAYWRELFAAIRAAGLLPPLTFECFSLPTAAFVDDFARTFDLARSALVLSPGTADAELRRRLHGAPYPNDALELMLEHARGRGVATHVCFSVYPQEGWPETRATARWMRWLSERYGAGLYVSPIEMEPYAPWHRDPERYGLRHARASFADFLERHEGGHYEREWASEVGYEAPEVGVQALLLRSLVDARAWARQGLSGILEQPGTRAVLAPLGALDAVLALLPRWSPETVALVLTSPDAVAAPAIEEIGRRITAASASINRVICLTRSAIPSDDAPSWDATPYRVVRASQALPEPDGVLQAVLVRTPRDAAAVLRGGVGGPGDTVLVDACRFGRAPCPAVAGRRLCVGPNGELGACSALTLGATSGWDEALEQLRALATAVERDRGCADCAVRAECARCLAPQPLTATQYCAAMRTGWNTPAARDDSRQRAIPGRHGGTCPAKPGAGG